MRERLTRFVDADDLGGYQVLGRLADHAATSPTWGRDETAAYHLEELALISAVLAWWTRWRPISIHRAVLAGATRDQVAEAMGATVAEATGEWRAWAVGQRRLQEREGRWGITAREYAAVAAVLDPPGHTERTREGAARG